MSERKLATIEEILAIEEIPNADAIEVATVRGWKVVVRKGHFKVGEQVCYFEIDSALPIAKQQFSFLAGKNEKLIDGVWYHVLKTAKFRGQVSQGLVIKLDEFGIGRWPYTQWPFPNGHDVTEFLHVIKYEKPIPGEAGNIANAFPTWLIQKTDSERVQNLSDAILAKLAEEGVWVATEKIDGQSITFWMEEDGLHTATRNWEIRRPEAGESLPAPWKVAAELDLANIIPVGGVIQGELYGEGIQANPLGIKGVRFALFNTKGFRVGHDFPAVPVYHGLSFPKTIKEAVEQADGIRSLVVKDRLAEGVVWHEANGKTFPELGNRSTFKAISNKYLGKQKD